MPRHASDDPLQPVLSAVKSGYFPKHLRIRVYMFTERNDADRSRGSLIASYPRFLLFFSTCSIHSLNHFRCSNPLRICFIVLLYCLNPPSRTENDPWSRVQVSKCTHKSNSTGTVFLIRISPLVTYQVAKLHRFE